MEKARRGIALPSAGRATAALALALSATPRERSTGVPRALLEDPYEYLGRATRRRMTRERRVG